MRCDGFRLSGACTGHMPIRSDADVDALPKPTWVPTEAHDAKLMKIMSEPSRKVPSSGRSTMGRNGVPRILEGASFEALPEALRVLLAETDDQAKGQDTVDASLPGTRKRRFQELADTVDRDLIIENEVETVCHLPLL